MNDPKQNIASVYYFDMIAPGVYQLKSKAEWDFVSVLLLSFFAMIPVVMLSFVIMSDIPHKHKWWSCGFISAVSSCIFLVKDDLVVDVSCSSVTKYLRFLRLPVWIRRINVRPSDYLASYVTRMYSETPREVTHQLMIVRGRRRFRIIFLPSKSAEPDEDIESIALPLATMLKIEYRSYPKNEPFFWW